MRALRWLDQRLLVIEQATGGYCSPMVTVFLGINTLIFMLCLFTGYPSPVAQALLANDQIWQGQVWRALTAAFTHEQVMHWFWNMLALFFFGRHLENLFGRLRFVLFVLFVAILGNLFHVGVMQGSVLGFSGVVYGLIIGFAAHTPTAPVLAMLVLRIPAWVLAAILVLLDTLHFIQFGSERALTAYDVHLLGAACGFIAVRWRWMLSPLLRRLHRRRQRHHEQRQHWEHSELDRLLEKVSQQGLPSLSKRERSFLERYSKSQRDD